MATRAVGPGRGWSWLKQAVNLGSHNPRALIGAAAIMLAIAIVPTLVQLLAQQVMGADNMGAAGASVLFSLLYAMLVMPPAMAGFLRVIHATETGAPTRAAALLDGYRQEPGRVIGMVVVLMVLAMAIAIGILMLFGQSMLAGLAEFMAATQSMQPGQTSGLPALPEGIGKLFGAFLLFGLFFNGVYAISIGQVVLGGRGIGESLKDGLSGALKNLLPLLVLLVIVLVLGFLALLVLGLLMMFIGAIGALVSPALGAVLMVPVYALMMMVVYVVMFGVIYFMWRDICGDDSSRSMARNDQVEV